MKLSLEWLRDYVDLPADLPVAALMHDLTMTTVEVESATAVDGDTVFEIDNKSLTNRPDLWGHYGIARELAAIYKLPLRPPAPPLSSLFSNRPPTEPLVGSTDPECRRFTATRFSNVRATASTTLPTVTVSTEATQERSASGGTTASTSPCAS